MGIRARKCSWSCSRRMCEPSARTSMGSRALCWMGKRRRERRDAEGGEGSACCGVDGQDGFEERLEKLQVEGVGAVGFGIGRIFVDFDKKAVDAYGGSGAREQWNEFRLAAADAVGCGGLLDGVSGVKDDGREAAHDGERPEIDDQVIVAEG